MNRRDSIKTITFASIGAGLLLEGCYGISREKIKRSLTRYEYGRTPEEKLYDDKLFAEKYFTNYELFTFIDTENPTRLMILGAELITTGIYVGLGLISLSYGRRVLDWLTPFDLNKEIVIDRDNAVGLVEGGFYVSMAVIIHGIIA